MVYEAYDRQEKVPVALKVLRFAEADALYRFKNGVRLLADIRHPNLISFHGLESVDSWWFLIMELVDGVEFIEAMHGPSSALDSRRLRDGLGQLTRGLDALHRHGRLHRDIKPSNVMVTGEGRVVLLDFGLVTELERVDIIPTAASPAEEPSPARQPAPSRQHPGSSTTNRSDTNMVGTPAYMAPEQAEGWTSPASDWYSVGVMLYETLTGELPFSGTLVDVFSRKSRETPRDPREGTDGLPDDLVEICLGLLQPAAARRLTAEQVLERLGMTPPAFPGPPGGAAGEAAFVGRRETLEELRQALRDSRSRAVTVYVKGPSGVGKTALVHRFLEEARGRSAPDQSVEDGSRWREKWETVVLTGRCFLGESVPYKALDSLIDALSRYLTQLPEQEAETLLPVHVVELGRLFPVLRRVDAVARRRGSGLDVSDPQAIRRRAFEALRELLAGLAERCSVILFVDDLQWGDVDSFQLLEEVLRPPDSPPLLTIGCYRSEDRVTSPFLGALSEQLRSAPGGDVRELDLSELSAAEAQELVQVLQQSGGGTGGLSAARPDTELTALEVEEIVREGGGSPLFLAELMRYSSEVKNASLRGSLPGPHEGAGETTSAAPVDLSSVILARISQLADTERRLLEVVSLAGQPLDLSVASQAAGIASGFGAVVDRLHALRLLRRVAADQHNEVETYHDRIREAVVESLDPAVAERHHRQLAAALEATGTADPESLVVHFRATRQVARACEYAIRAAQQAEEALAFERAARLFRLALDLTPQGSRDLYRLRMKLGHALAHAGRGHEAAESLLAAVESSGTLDPLEAQRDAAEQLLISGHIDRGLAILRHVLRTVGMEFKTPRWKAFLELRWLRFRLALGRATRRDRPEQRHGEAEAADEVLLRRIDVCWSVEIGLCLVDVLYASEFHARHLLLALEAGDPRRIGRGMAMEVFFGVLDGSDPRPALQRARRLAARLEEPSIARLADMAVGLRAAAKGQWHEADRRLTRAEEKLREQGPGVVWELDTVHQLRILARLHLGHWGELFEEMPRLLKHARQRGDRYLEIHLRHWVECLYHLAGDRPRQATETAEEAIGGWSHQGFHFQHFGHLAAITGIALYRGDGERALAQVEAKWPELERSMIQRIEMVRVQSYDLRARSAIAAAVTESSRPRRSKLLGRARRDARRLERTGSAWTGALASVVRAGIASAGDRTGDRKEAPAVRIWLEKAEALFCEADMPLHATVARRRRAQSLGDASRVEEADRELGQHGVLCPERLCDMLAPGMWDVEIFRAEH